MPHSVVIIGAGMSGLAAGIRLAHYGLHVTVVERHHLIGGLNSYYRRRGHTLDVGLHAMTNFVRAGERRGPLPRLLRQLRLRYEDLDLREQRESAVLFPAGELRFSNDLGLFESEVERLFRGQIDGFRRLVERVQAFDAFSHSPPVMSSRDVLAECITDPVLSDMILCPVMFYGSAGEGDMPFADFALLFGSMFLEGLCRPAGGIVPLLERLRERLLESGAELVTGCGVEQLVLDGGAVSEVVLEDGRRMASDIVLSSAGLRETLRLCPTALPVAARAGRISVVEVILGLDCPVRDLGWERSVAFLSERNAFDFRCPGTLVDQSTGVVTAPGNFAGEGTEDDSGIHWLRLTRLASPELWLGEAEYGAAKHRVEAEIVAATAARMPGLEEHVVFRDCFTPRTIARFTGHENGALYGSPDKRRDGTVPGVRNLFLSGTDQGFLGVVGALMSGVAMANVHVLSAL